MVCWITGGRGRARRVWEGRACCVGGLGLARVIGGGCLGDLEGAGSWGESRERWGWRRGA